jgi:uncharacterized protein YggU (UPF0235/DUF167 family)
MYIKVRVNAGVKKETITKKSEDSYVLNIKEKAERNMANRRVCSIIAEIYNLPIKNIRIINGHHSPSKILSVDL